MIGKTQFWLKYCVTIMRKVKDTTINVCTIVNGSIYIYLILSLHILDGVSIINTRMLNFDLAVEHNVRIIMA